MKTGAAIAEILKREGVEFLIGYPVNPIIEAAPRPTSARSSSARSAPACTWPTRCQPHHVGRADRRLRDAERAGHGERLRRRRAGLRRIGPPIVVLPGGYPRRLANVQPNFSALLNYQHVTKSLRAGDDGREIVPT